MNIDEPTLRALMRSGLLFHKMYWSTIAPSDYLYRLFFKDYALSKKRSFGLKQKAAFWWYRFSKGIRIPNTIYEFRNSEEFVKHENRLLITREYERRTSASKMFLATRPTSSPMFRQFERKKAEYSDLEIEAAKSSQ